MNVRRVCIVECCKHVLIVYPGKRDTYWRCSSEMMKEEMDCEQWKGDERYEVVDKASMRMYHLNMNERSHPCDCHCRKWKKIPCIHVMRVLHWLLEYWRVWDYVGGVYRHETVSSTGRYLNKEKELLLWLPTMGYVELDEEEISPIFRSFKTNRRRSLRVGEDQVCMKRQRIKKNAVCFK